ncbi:MAG TPA: DHH family phosphoesterase, partial [Aggregatilineales bacterium]|nr:DHH family phosphoesterase [Aggregatilineales bacterium]
MSASSILVIGHRNPDTDAIAAAVGYAWVLNAQGGESYLAARTGKINPQTAFALDHFGIEAPTFVADVWGRVADLSEALPSLHRGQTLLDACRMIAETRRPAPVLSDGGSPVGLLSGADLFGSLAEALSTASVLALARELERPVETAIDAAGLLLHPDDHIRDVIGGALRTNQDDFLVVDQAGKYVGLCRKTGLLAPARRKVVMVDHNEPGQAVPGLEDADLIEVLDHHRLGNIPTTMPIRFHVDPVGSCSTLVAERGFEAQGTVPDKIAALLLCGILSDTLIFRSPTTTPRDQAAGQRLAVMAGLVPHDADEDTIMAALRDLGQKLLAAGEGLGSQTADELISNDLKYFEANGASVAIAQVEVANLRELAPRLDDIRGALKRLVEAKNLALAMLMV